MAPDPKHSKTEVNGVAPDSRLLQEVQKVSSGLSSEIKAYIMLAGGLFLFLFSIGYFEILKVGLGVIGFGMMVWGAINSKLLTVIASWFNKIVSYFTKR